MNNINHQPLRGTDGYLEGVIEPLAAYICATERPQTALKQALSVLFSQVEETNRAASIRVAAFRHQPARGVCLLAAEQS
jgi:hypothetical protein